MFWARGFAAAGTVYGVALLASRHVHAEAAPSSTTASSSQLRSLKTPSRHEHLEKLRSTHYDVLVVGGGATGAGIALDAVSRGLKVAMVEKSDFTSGTSSRSTKLIHGGVRYLEKAFLELSIEQFELVQEALHERETLLHIAPHVAKEVPIMVPIYKWWQVPYMWVGLKMYDLIARIHHTPGHEAVSSSYILPRARAEREFPMLKADGLCACLVYYDGMHDDAAMGLSIALTAAEKGATVLNYAEIVSLKQEDRGDGSPQVQGAVVRDRETGEEITVHARSVINATGCFTDGVLKMDQPAMDDLVVPSKGIHLILPSFFCSQTMGILQPSSDGRVIFFLPWERHVLIGTTDSPTKVTDLPTVEVKDVDFVLKELRLLLGDDVTISRSDVLAAWSGIRPLVRKPSSKGTQDIPRTHFVHQSASGLITIAGGKWTTYRQMAEDTVDFAIKAAALSPTMPCQTKSLVLSGGEGYKPSMHVQLIQQYGLADDVAEHLAHRYGVYAVNVIEQAQSEARDGNVYKRLVDGHPYLEAEVTYAVEKEYAVNAVDILARRTRLAFLDSKAAHEALPKVINILAKRLSWSDERAAKETKTAEEFLSTMTFSVSE